MIGKPACPIEVAALHTQDKSSFDVIGHLPIDGNRGGDPVLARCQWQPADMTKEGAMTLASGKAAPNIFTG
jgi:hypothetical protein